VFVKQVREICSAKLKTSFDDLCGRLMSTNKTEVDEGDLRRLQFCDFSDLKTDDKFYKEITDIDNFRSIAEGLLVKYNEVSRKPMDLTLFDFALEHLGRISRVLKQPESHMMIIGVGGSGRQSLSRLATHIAGYEFYQFEMGKDDGIKEWRDSLKNVLKKTSLTINHNVLFLYESQVI
jgi:dynein heavy chain